MSTLADALARATEKLRAAGIDSARLDARVLMAHVLGVEPNELHAETRRRGEGRALRADMADSSNPPLKEKELRASAPPREKNILEEFESLIARRAAREPVAYITGRKGFWDLDFEVGPGALVPRPETETLIEEVLREFPDKTAPLKIIDLGTGTGCILLTLLHLYPNATGLGVDASDDALRWAERNRQQLGLESRCELRRADWNELTETGFDLAVSNPPYLSAADMKKLQPELAFEPAAALMAAEDGLSAYRALAPILLHLLKPRGCTALEIGQGQGEAVPEILRAQGLEIVRITPDLSGIPRCVVARRPR